MNKGLTVAAFAGFALYLLSKGGTVQPTVLKTERQKKARALVTRIALELGVPVNVALAFASLESNLNPDAEGDLQWVELHPDRYQALVLDSARFADNPWRTDRSRWHSYGLFQLLAPHHALPMEDPRALLDAETNARRGLAYIKNLLKKNNGDVDKARLAFAGASKLSGATQDMLVARLHRAMAQFEGVA